MDQVATGSGEGTLGSPGAGAGVGAGRRAAGWAATPAIQWGILAAIILGAAALRFYRLSELTFFLGDQARDIARVQRMIERLMPAVLGSGASVGTYSRGPAYYYLILIPVWVSGGHPVSPAVLGAVVDLGTIVLLFVVGRMLFSAWVGLAAAALWSCAPLTVLFARWAWNPNLLPFFVLLIVLALGKIARGDTRYLLLAVPSWCVAWQLHEQSLLMLPFFAGFALWARPRIERKYWLGALALGLVTLAPFVLYEVLHGFRNTRGMLSFAVHGGAGLRTGGVLGELAVHLGTTVRMLGRLIPGEGFVHVVLEVAAVAGVLWLLANLGARRYRRESVGLLALWLTVPLMYAFWPGSLFAHYLAILFPMVFLLIGLCLDMLWRVSPRAGILAAVALALFVVGSAGRTLVAMRDAPIGPGTLGATRVAVRHVIAAAEGQPFAFRLVSKFDGSEAFEAPYTYLFHWYRVEPTAGTDVQRFTVYDPESVAGGAGKPGVVLNGIKIVREPAP